MPAPKPKQQAVARPTVGEADSDSLGGALAVYQGRSLVVGECDFSFSVSLTSAAKGTADFKLTSTAHAAASTAGPGRDTKLGKCIAKNHKLLEKRGADVRFGVDATAIEETPELLSGAGAGGYERILFTFPRASTARGKQTANGELLSGFFASAAPLLSKADTTDETDGCIVLLLNVCAVDLLGGEDGAVPLDQWEDWGVADIAEAHGLERVAVQAYDPQEFPQYQPRAVNGESFVPGVRRGGVGGTAAEIGRNAPPPALWHFLARKDATRLRADHRQGAAAALARNAKRLQRHAAGSETEMFPVPAAVAKGLAAWEITCDVNKGRKLQTPDCVHCVPGFLSDADADRAYQELLQGTSWELKARNNRKTAYFVHSASADDADSGFQADKMTPFPDCLLTIKRRVEEWYRQQTGSTAQDSSAVDFNVCVANFYEDGQQSIAWHTDFEEFGRSTPIASVSLGARRQFLLRSVSAADAETDRAWISLGNGALLLMQNLCQHRYVHCVPRDPKVTTGRINLTFRIVPPDYLRTRQKSYF